MSHMQLICAKVTNMSEDSNRPKLAKIIQMPTPIAPLPHPIPFATPSPEDALIEMIDLDKEKSEDE
jgi:hypothetical protein